MESTQNCPQARRKHIINTRHGYSKNSLIFPPISPDLLISYGSNWAHHFPDFCLTSPFLAINHTSLSPEPLVTHPCMPLHSCCPDPRRHLQRPERTSVPERSPCLQPPLTPPPKSPCLITLRSISPKHFFNSPNPSLKNPNRGKQQPTLTSCTA